MKGKIKTTLLIAVLLISTITIAIPMASAIEIPAFTETGTADPVSSGNVGDKVTVTTLGITMGGLVKVYWDSVKAWDGTAGLLAEGYAVGSKSTINIVIPETVTGEHYVIVKDIEASQINSHVFEVIPEIKLTPKSGIAGDTITIKGTGFPSSETLDIFFGDGATSTAVRLIQSGLSTVDWTADPVVAGTYGDVVKLVGDAGSDSRAGVYIDSALTPASINLATIGFEYYRTVEGDIPDLELRFEAPTCIDADDDTSDNRGHVDITISGGIATLEEWTEASYSANPATLIAFGNDPGTGDDIVFGTYADWDALVAMLSGMSYGGISYDNWILTRISPQVGWSILGTYYIDNVKVGTNTYDLEQPVKTTTSGSLGSFTTTYKTSVDEAPGVKRVSMIGDIDNSFAFADFDMGTCITLTPGTGIPGTGITVLGRGFTEEETVDIRWYYSYPGGVYLTVVNDYPIDSTGVFTTTFNVPLVETTTYYVVAIDSSDEHVTSPVVEFAVTGVTGITLTDATGLVGDTFTVDGVWFTPSKTAEITFDETVLATDVGINANGVLDTTNVEVPDVALGIYTVTVTDEEGLYATATFTVIEEVITIETNSESYDPGDTLSFTIESTVAFNPATIAMVINDPDDYTFWEVTWSTTPKTSPATGCYVPYSEQVDEGGLLHLTLPSDAKTGIWEWTATYSLVPGTNIEETGTFTVGEPVGPQPDLPAETTNPESKDSTGAPKTSFVLGETVLASAKVTNTGTQSQSMLIIVQWTDPQLRALAPVFIIVELGPGQSFTYAPGIILPLTGYATGTWTAKVLVLDTWPAQGGVTIGAPVTITITVS